VGDGRGELNIRSDPIVGKRCEGAERLVVAEKSLIKGWSQGAVFMWTGALGQPAMGGAGESAETETVLYFQA
jgi:hypothetical protein